MGGPIRSYCSRCWKVAKKKQNLITCGWPPRHPNFTSWGWGCFLESKYWTSGGVWMSTDHQIGPKKVWILSEDSMSSKTAGDPPFCSAWRGNNGCLTITVRAANMLRLNDRSIKNPLNDHTIWQKKQIMHLEKLQQPIVSQQWSSSCLR